MAKIFNRAIKLCGEPIKIGTYYITVLEYDVDGMVMRAKGADVPENSDAGFAVGCQFIDTSSGAGGTFYVNEGSVSVADFNIAAGEGATSATFVGLSDTPANFTAGANKFLRVNGAGNAVEFDEVTGDVTIGATGTTAIASKVIVNADVNDSAAIAYSKLSLTGSVVSGDLAGSVAVGKIALTTGSIMLGTASVGAALDAKTSGQILVGSGSTLASVAVSGDISLDAAGDTEVSDLTLASEADGDIAYRAGGAWVRLGKGTSNQYLEGGDAPSWSLPALASAGAIQDGAELSDAGDNDATISFTTQGTAGASVVIPNFAAAAAFTFGFLSKAQTWTENQTIEYGHLLLGDSDSVQTLQILVNEDMTGNHTLTIKPNDGDRELDISGNINVAGNFTTTVGTVAFAADSGGSSSLTLPATGTVATLAGAEAFTNKTLTLPKIVTGGKIVDANGAEWIEFLEDATPVDHLLITQGDTGVGLTLTATSSGTNSGGLLLDAKGTGDIVILDGSELTIRRATKNALIVIADQTVEDHTFNIPDIATGASDTFAFLAEAQTLTNKTIDVDSNTVSNVNADELDPIAIGNYGIPFVVSKDVSAASGDTSVITDSSFKFRVLDAWSLNTSAAGGVWSIKSDAGKISDDVTAAANDKDIDRISQIDNAYHEIAASTGDLIITSDASFVGTIYVLCMRVN